MTTKWILKCGLAMALAAIWFGNFAIAQQMPNSLYGLSNPRIFNTAAAGGWKMNQLVALHQQRGDLANGWGRISDFLSFGSAQGRSRLGWGFQVLGDHDHTDSRVALSPTISAGIIQRPGLRVGLGISGGFLYYGSNYTKTPIFHNGDPKLANNGFIELDAGLGGDMAWRNRWMHGDLGIYTTQLPGNAISGKVPGALNFVPHLMGYGGVLFQVAYNLSLGPRAFYKNTIFAQGEKLQKAQLDIGLKAEFDRQNLWFAAGYRTGKSGLTAGLGAKIWERDSIQHRDQVYLGLNLMADFSIPGWGNNVLGPTAEIGLGLEIGQRYRSTRVDTVVDTGPIWESTANLTAHKDKFLAPGSPPSIVAGLIPLDSHIVISYEFPDDSRNYVGENLTWEQDSLLSRIGAEWVGMDNFIENLMNETVEECLSPEMSRVAHPERMDSLRRLMWVQLRTDLKWDRQAATTGPGISYQGELNEPGHKQDSLIFKVVYDERDTTVAIPPRGHYLNNFELAALKLYAMRKKLEYELKRYYAEQHRNVVVAWEDQPMNIHWDVNADEVEIKAASPLFILKLRIESDHPKQKALQLTTVTLKFRRYREGESRVRYYTPGEGEVFSDHGETNGPNDGRKKHPTRLDRLLQREDFVRVPTEKKPPREKRQRTAPTTPSGNSLDH